MPELMGESFPKPKAGRPVRVDISAMRHLADSNPGQIVGDVFEERDAQSVRRQFQNLPGYKVMTTKHESGSRRVLVMKY